MRQSKERKRIFSVSTIPVTIFMVYTLYITVCTWCDALSFLAEIQVPFYVLSAIFMVVLYAVLSHIYTFEFRKYKIRRLGFLYGAFVLLLTFLRSLIPDCGYDTLNYHLLSQAPFRQGFDGNCAPGNFQLYGFALGDKLYTLPRMLFGYRAGSMFSGVILCLMLYQVSELLNLLCGKRLAYLRKRYFSGPVTKYFSFVLKEETWAFLAVFLHDSVMLLGSYYVELFAIVYLLEAIYQLLSPEKDSPENAAHFILCVGFLFAVKMTNVVFLLPLVILYLVKIRKILSPGLFLSCLVLGFFPCAPYLLVNWIEYENPVFPYYNTIFKSPYFPEADFKDARFGPQTLQETLLWPFYMIFCPDYRQTEISMPWTGGLAVGMISAVAAFVISIRDLVKRKSTQWPIFSLAVMVIISFVLWEMTTSISRYYLGGYILLNCLFAWFCTEHLLGKTRLQCIAGSLCCVLFILQPISVVNEYWKGREWSWRKVTVASVTKNIPYLFQDRAPRKEDLTEKPSAYFAVDYLSGISQVLIPNAPIYRMEYLYDTLEGDVQQYLIQEADGILREGNAYLLSNSKQFGMQLIEKMNRYGLYADTLSVVQESVFNTVWDTLQMHVVPCKEGQSNILYTTPFTLAWNGERHLTAQCYIPNNEKKLYLKLQDNIGNLLYFAPLNEDGTLKLSLDLPLTMGTTVEWTLTDEQGVQIVEDVSTLMVLNPEFTD